MQRLVCAILGMMALAVWTGGAMADRGATSIFNALDAGKRVALVVGNGAYRNVLSLANPRNDATDMAGLLRKLDFNVVEGIDLDRSGMEQAVSRFASLASDASVTLFYFAGHGIQVAGENHLLPIDADLRRDDLLEFQTVKLDTVLKLMSGKGKIAIALLDACRDSPAVGSTSATRSLGGGGLAVPQNVGGVMIGFATAPGKTAADGVGRNSPFATALLRRLGEPDLEIGQAMRRVMGDVEQLSNGRQRPWVHSDIAADFYMVPQPSAVPGERKDVESIVPAPLVRLEPPRDPKPSAIRRFGVFHAQEFDLCGFRNFKATPAESRVRIVSRDAAIPDRSFRGYEKILPLGERIELWNGCAVTVSKERTAGVERIYFAEEGGK